MSLSSSQTENKSLSNAQTIQRQWRSVCFDGPFKFLFLNFFCYGHGNGLKMLHFFNIKTLHIHLKLYFNFNAYNYSDGKDGYVH